MSYKFRSYSIGSNARLAESSDSVGTSHHPGTIKVGGAHLTEIAQTPIRKSLFLPTA
jgi:hypothetical protein